MAALVDLSRNKTIDKKYSIFARWQHLILSLFGGGLHMCRCAYVVVRVWLMFVHMCVKRFDVYGDESESMSDQYRFFVFLVIY